MIKNDVSFQSGEITLAGTLSMPNNVEHPPAVLFIHGSGPLDRNENAKAISINALTYWLTPCRKTELLHSGMTNEVSEKAKVCISIPVTLNLLMMPRPHWNS